VRVLCAKVLFAPAGGGSILCGLWDCLNIPFLDFVHTWVGQPTIHVLLKSNVNWYYNKGVTFVFILPNLFSSCKI